MKTLDNDLQAFISACHNLQPKVQPKTQNTRKAKSQENEHGAKVGDVLYSDWGYEQTNYDLYEVIKTTQKTVTLKKLTGYDAGRIYINRKTVRNAKDYYTVNSLEGVGDYPVCHFDDRQAATIKKRLSYQEEFNGYLGH